MRVMSMEMPPCTGFTCPSSDEPAPKGTIGHWCLAQARDDRLDVLVGFRKHDAVRHRRGMVRFAAGVMLAHRCGRGQPAPPIATQLVEQRFRNSPERHVCYLTAGASIVMVPFAESISTSAPTGSVH